jgi:hypothetical protein
MPASRRPASADPRIALLADNLDRAYAGRSWHGTSLRGTLRGLTPDVALWRPAPGRNSVWQYLLHAAYWKYVIRRKLTGAARASFPRVGANFPDVPAAADTAALKADLRLLDDQHALLRDAVLALDAGQLERKRGSWRTVDYVLGAAAHDLYHAGQINLVKRLRAK